MEKKGTFAEVLRRADGYDCTAGGVTSKHATVTLIGRGAPELRTPSESSPALYLATWYGRTIACPEDLEAKYPKKRNDRPDCSIEYLGGWMFGGNFVHSSDNRFPSEAPIFVYDRREF
jgi:hypothetical protein